MTITPENLMVIINEVGRRVGLLSQPVIGASFFFNASAHATFHQTPNQQAR
jgi:hypothetical protein